MGNENERKHNPAESRENWMGGGPDSAKKGGGNESNVGLTGPAGGGGGIGAGSGGVIGGSADFLTDPEPASETAETAVADRQSVDTDPGQSRTGEPGFGAQQGLSSQQGGDTTFGGSGSGASFLASNSGQSDLGSAGVGPGGAPTGEQADPGDIAGVRGAGGEGNTLRGDHSVGGNTGTDIADGESSEA